ncbi:MAG TPA: hypothetical protein VJL84_12105 [Kiloniellales bacterium]|nr:hypothetical protein [Kiloniellales bacterium]
MTVSESPPTLVSLLPSARELAQALALLQEREALSLPLIDARATATLLDACERLTYRAARPLVGPAGQEVRQDFELSMDIGPDDPIRQLAAALTVLTTEARALLPQDPVPEGLVFNDLIVQRYVAGSAGITPHRDHLRYRGIVVLVTLLGRSELLLCDDRAGSNPRGFPMAPGVATLMLAPGYGGGNRRPFHCVAKLSEPRVSLGLRHDTRPAS